MEITEQDEASNKSSLNVNTKNIIVRMIKLNPLTERLSQRNKNKNIGIYSACTANDITLAAVMERAVETNTLALIEATANQVNQYGGYTGMQPADFVAYIQKIADSTDLSLNKLILGGDHLGPLTWQNEPEESAMAKAEILVRDFVLAGFTKIHLDTSMRLADDDKKKILSDEIIAQRAARLCRVAEDAFIEYSNKNKNAYAPVYIVGSEVPIPGGAIENDESVSVTLPEQFKNTYCAFRDQFQKAGLEVAFERVIGVVVQPGVEFSDLTVTEYDHTKASRLSGVLLEYPGLVFEGHSTDYQTREKLKEMVNDGVAILKVGPALTYALRQGLFALQDIECELLAEQDVALSDFRAVLEKAMLSNPIYWQKYYHGQPSEIALKRKYSFSDRCRYYLPNPDVSSAIQRLIHNIDHVDVPMSLLEQYMPLEYRKFRSGEIDKSAQSLLKEHIKGYINDYIYATT